MKIIELSLGKQGFALWLRELMDRAELTDKDIRQIEFEKFIEKKGLN
ncbi:hypothetical protein GQR36_17330 [Enterococcus termitis]